VPAARVWSSACGLPAHRRWVVRADGSASCSHPQGVPRLRVCRIPSLGSVLHARMRVHPSLARARCLIVCTNLSRRPPAAPPALQALLYQSLQRRSAILPEQPQQQPQRRRLPVPRLPSCPCPAARAGCCRGAARGGGWQAAGGQRHAGGGKDRLFYLYSTVCGYSAILMLFSQTL
jgi:hypothetical protein